MAETRYDPDTAAFADAEAIRRPASYASPTILARRQRILAETCALIGERGLNGFSLEDVARRAQVAKRTVYNAFRSKDHLVAVAITRFIDENVTEEGFRHAPATLEGVCERLDYGAGRMPELRPFAAALSTIHFSHGLDPGVRLSVHHAAGNAVAPWIGELSRTRQLEPWADPERLVDILVGFTYATVHEWIEARIPDDAFRDELVGGILSIVAGSVRSKTRKEIGERLTAGRG